MAANGLLRYVLGAAFPLFTVQSKLLPASQSTTFSPPRPIKTVIIAANGFVAHTA